MNKIVAIMIGIVAIIAIVFGYKKYLDYQSEYLEEYYSELANEWARRDLAEAGFDDDTIEYLLVYGEDMTTDEIADVVYNTLKEGKI